MKSVPIIWAWLWRKPLRTVLTFLSIVVAFVLFGLLQGVDAAFSGSVMNSNVDRLLVMAKVSFTELLPESYGPRIAHVPGVKALSHATWFGGYFRTPTSPVTAMAVEPKSYFAIYREFNLPPDQLGALARTPDGVVVGHNLAKRYGWKIGDRVPIHSDAWFNADGNSDWIFQIVGIYDDASGSELFLLNERYFSEARAMAKGRLGWFIVSVANPAASASVAQNIDRLFANSPDETRTITEKEFAQNFVRQIGDVGFIVKAIMAAVLFALLFLIWNTMAQSVRERSMEFGVMKAIGFSSTNIVGLIIAESIILCGAAALVGLAVAAFMYPSLSAFVGTTHLPMMVILDGIAASVVLAVAAAAIPGWMLSRLRIVDALSRRS